MPRSESREVTPTVQLRVVTDQPWDVKADVLVIPIVGEPTFEGPLDELDRRAGGELRALATFRELTGKRFATCARRPGELPAGRLLTVGVGDPATLDRESVVRVAAAAERRLGGREVRSMAIWLTPLAGADGLDGGADAGGRARRARRGRGRRTTPSRSTATTSDAAPTARSSTS